MARYHVNSKTGNPNQCRAKEGNCPFGSPAEHYGTKEAAREAYEAQQMRELLPESASKAEAKPKKWFGGHYEGERDVVDGRPGRWSTSVRVNGKPTFFADDAGRQDDPSTLPNSFEATGWERVKRPAEGDGAFVGLQETQRETVAYLNHEGRHEWSVGTLYGGPVAEHTDELVRRVLNGERSKVTAEVYDRNFKQFSPKEKLFFNLTNPESSIASHSEVDAFLVFPERDLYPELKRLGVEQVSVSSLMNGREVGLVYTVLTPSGDSRSFSLYEHRNTDSLIINGETNWDPQGPNAGPYASNHAGEESKNFFFAEFSYAENRRVVASTLAFFLKEAQKGELASDAELVEKAEKLDWGAILSEKIPGFGEWREKQEEERLSARDPEDDFEQWARDF